MAELVARRLQTSSLARAESLVPTKKLLVIQKKSPSAFVLEGAYVRPTVAKLLISWPREASHSARTCD